jgi:hypothetical protein
MYKFSLSDACACLEMENPDLYQHVRSMLQPGLRMPKTHPSWDLISDMATYAWLAPQDSSKIEGQIYRLLWGAWIAQQYPCYCLSEEWLAKYEKNPGTSTSRAVWERPTTPFLLCFPRGYVMTVDEGALLDCLLVKFSDGPQIVGQDYVTRLDIVALDNFAGGWYTSFAMRGGRLRPQPGHLDEWFASFAGVVLEATRCIPPSPILQGSANAPRCTEWIH